MNAYEEKRVARIDRMRARAERLRRVGESRLSAEHAILDAIPLGQPILVGHHSERRHRRALERAQSHCRKGLEALEHAKTIERRAAFAEENTAISSDDPDAIEKLRAKLAEEEAAHAAYKVDAGKARKAIKGKPREEWYEALQAAGVSERLTHTIQVCGFLPTVTGNGSANLRRIKARIAELEAKAARPAPTPEVYGDVQIEESDNRVRVYFPAKPSEAVRSTLKSYGFRWSPTEGAWQRHASETAWYYARKIAGAT